MADIEEAKDFLAHHGVKGMHWGIRKDRGHEGERATSRKIASLDKKYVRKATSRKTYFKIYNAMADRLNTVEISKINNDPRFKGKDLTNNKTLQKQYYDTYSSRATKILNEEAAKELGSSASGKQLKFSYDVSADFLPKFYIEDGKDG